MHETDKHFFYRKMVSIHHTSVSACPMHGPEPIMGATSTRHWIIQDRVTTHQRLYTSFTPTNNLAIPIRSNMFLDCDGRERKLHICRTRVKTWILRPEVKSNSAKHCATMLPTMIILYVQGTFPILLCNHWVMWFSRWFLSGMNTMTTIHHNYH